MKIILNLFLFPLIFLSKTFAQDFKVDVFEEKQIDGSVAIYANSSFPCPITLKITFKNLKNICDADEKTLLVEVNDKKKLL